MNKKIFLLTTLVLFISSFAFALDVPNHKGYVTDYTNTLTPQQIAQLDTKLKQHEKETSNQIVVLIISSLEGDDLEQFATKVFEQWKIGQKKKDNGALLLIVLNDRKLRIETGYGIEGPLPDSLCGTIIRQDITPKFKEGNHFAGINTGIDKIILALKGEYKNESESNNQNDGIIIWGLVLFGATIFVAGLLGLIHWIMGGLVGGVGSFFISSSLMEWPIQGIIPAVIIGFVIGSIAKIILESIAEGGGGYGGGEYSSPSSSPSSDGDSFTGGGGSSGGGGASGSW